MSIVLADCLYPVGRDLDDDYAEYDVCEPSSVKYVAMIVEDVIKLRAHEDVFCSGLQFAIRYKSLPSDKVEVRVCTRENSGESGERAMRKKG